MHCCLHEQKAYNPFYALLAHRLIQQNPQSYRYSFKYTLWDYLKSLDNLNLKQVSNLAKLAAFLFAEQAAPLHFLKVIDLEEDEIQGKTGVFLHLVFMEILEVIKVEDKMKLAKVIEMGLNEKDIG